MATININKREVVKINRNKRTNEITNSITASTGATNGTVIDWAEITPALVTVNRDLHVTGNITATKDVVAYIAGAVTSNVLDVLSVSLPLVKTGTNIALNYDANQFQLTGNALQIKPSILIPAIHNQDISTINGLTTALSNKIETSLKGAVNGLAELDGNGFVKNAQLPSYVDDVLEYASFAALPVTGESGKIYITTDSNKTFRWSGSVYAEISASLALGTTSATAYRGDFGNTAYNHSLSTSNPHSVSKSQVDLGNADNTSDANKPISTATQTALNLKADLLSPTFSGTVTASSLLLNAVDAEILKNDNFGQIRIAGGLSASSSNGGVIQAFGNSYATNSLKGQVKILAGKGDALTNFGSISLNTVNAAFANTERFKITGGVDTATASFTNSNLTVSGSIVSGSEITAFSDKRLKSNIQPLKVRADLKPVTYTKDGKYSIGFIAQDVKAIYPELVVGDEEKEMLSLNYQQLTAVLYAEIIELKERIKQLELSK